MSDIEFFFVGGKQEIAFVDVESSADPSVPATAQAGDIAVFLHWAGSVGLATPPDWNLITHTTGAGAGTHAAYWKELVSGDIGNPIAGAMLGTGNNKQIFVFRPLLGSPAVSVGSVNQEANSSGQPVTQTVVVGDLPSVVIGSGVKQVGSGASASPAFDAVNTLGILRTGYDVINEGESAVNRSITDLTGLGTGFFSLISFKLGIS